MFTTKKFAAFVLTAAFCFARFDARAQQTPVRKFELTVDSIMRGPDLVGYVPVDVRWSRDNQKIYFRWKRAGEPRLKDFDTYAVNRDGTEPRKLTEDEAKQAPPTFGDLSKDKRLTAFTDEGDVFVFDHENNIRRQITRTVDVESNPRFAADSKRVYYTRQNNLYLLSLNDGSLVQLTDIRAAGAGGAAVAAAGDDSQRKGTDSQEALKKEERELLEAVRERRAKREENEKKKKEREKRRPLQLTTGQTVASLTLSPDETVVIAVINELGAGVKNTIVPNYVTEAAYTEDIPSRNKVGDAQGRSRMAIINVETGEQKWVDHGQRAEVAPLTGVKTEDNATTQTAREQSGGQNQQQTQQTQQTQQAQGQQTGGQTPPIGQQQEQQTAAKGQAESKDREVQFFQLQWSDDGKRAAMLARSGDNKDRWVMLLDPVTAKTKILAQVHDDAWVGGPGSFTLGWLPDNNRVYYQSEQTGWAHLYAVSVSGGAPVAITSGNFEISDVRLSEDKTKFYFTSSEPSLFERHLYSMPLSGGARTRITTAVTGNVQANVSPDDTMLALIHSSANRPPEVYLAENKPNAELKQITRSVTDEWLSHNWIKPDIVSVKARDGATVYSRIYRPASPKPNAPAVVFVHGAGYLQNVHNWWSNYYREYMFHHLLAERGYYVLDIDYRGSAGYGRDWRTGIYRHMGGKDLTDHIDAAQYLVDEHKVDPKRIGIYGGSYGGFITLMAMFTTPDVFAAGAALRPVTDWAHYGHGYTSNILNLPQSDLEAYKRSSPIYHAAGLKGALLICHGMVDVNVHYQDSVRLAQKLIELRKENWEMASYPVEDHAFEQPTSWADEYKRILRLFENNLRPREEPARSGKRRAN